MERNTVLSLDRSDVRKEYAQKMKSLGQVWDGSEGEVHAGYWLCSVPAAEGEGSQITPLVQELFSTRAEPRPFPQNRCKHSNWNYFSDGIPEKK